MKEVESYRTQLKRQVKGNELMNDSKPKFTKDYNSSVLNFMSKQKLYSDQENPDVVTIRIRGKRFEESLIRNEETIGLGFPTGVKWKNIFYSYRQKVAEELKPLTKHLNGRMREHMDNYICYSTLEEFEVNIARFVSELIQNMDPQKDIYNVFDVYDLLNKYSLLGSDGFIQYAINNGAYVFKVEDCIVDSKDSYRERIVKDIQETEQYKELFDFPDVAPMVTKLMSDGYGDLAYVCLKDKIDLVNKRKEEKKEKNKKK